MSTAKELYDENGFYLAQNVFSEEQLVGMERDFDKIVDQLLNSGEDVNARWEGPLLKALDGGQSEIIHTHSVHRYSALWAQAFMNNRFLDVVEQLIGPDIILHHSKLFQKPAQHGSPFPIHQDWYYFPTKLDTMLAGIIFLGDADDEVGGLRVYPGSHKLGRLQNSWGQSESAELQKYPLENATAVSANRGDVLFFHYFTLHGSLPNNSDKIRKTVLAQLHAGNDEIEPDSEINHYYDALTLRGWNSKMNRSKATK